MGGANPDMPIQFFTTPGNTCPYAARTFIVLKELGMAFDMREVSGRPKPDWYLNTINPRGKVPAIQVPALDNEVVYESGICCEFLCDYSSAGDVLNYNPTELIPDDAVGRARMRLLNDHCDNVFTKTQFTFLMNKNETKDVESSLDMEEALLAYEKALEKSGGPFLLGKAFTLSDVHLLPFMQRLVVSLRHFKSYELPLDKFPRLLAWFELCSHRESVKGAALTEEKIIELYSMFVNMDYKFGGLNANKS
jgi:glutathione S-transferase